MQICLMLVFSIALVAMGWAKPGNKIIHDAEYYILKAQHGDKWAKEDKEIDKKLAELKKKHGTKPNIIHLMWDDTAVGEVGVAQNQASRGFKTPNMNKFAAEGQYYSRMYTEPSLVHQPEQPFRQDGLQ